MSATVIIPARYDSTRFPGKPLVKINGLSMIMHCVENAMDAVGIDNVYVATDDKRIAEAVNCKVIMTPRECKCSSDRVAEAVRGIDTDVVIDLQGDEPTIAPHDILNVISMKRQRQDYVINAYALEKGDIENKNTIKVVSRGMFTDDLIYMSRQPLGGRIYKRQLGIYGFYKQQLLDLYGVKRERGSFERLEDVHILRCLDERQKVLMLKLKGHYQSVDVPEDVKRVEEILCSRSS